MIICVFCVSILKRTLTYFSKLNDEGRYILQIIMIMYSVIVR